MGRRPGILILIKGLGIGGAEKLIASGARFWDRGAYRYHVAYALPWKDLLVPDLQALDVPVHVIGSRRGLGPSIAGRLRRLIRAIGADLVHAHLPTMGIIARLVSPVPVVYTEHNLADSYRLVTRIGNYLSYARNRRVIAVSEAVALSLRRYPGPTPIVVPNGVAVEVRPGQAEAAREVLDLGAHDPLVVHVGNIRPGKGHRTLVSAAALLKKSFPELTIVSIGGEKQPGDLARLQGQVEAAGLNGALRLLGRRPDALGFVAAADLFVNPAEVEGLPVAVLEAMALGRPVVATRVGGVPSLVRDGETGLLCDPDDPRGLAEAISRVLTDSALAERLGSAGKSLVERDFGLGTMTRTIEEHYARILDG